MKKIISLVLIMAMTLSLAACKGTVENTEPGTVGAILLADFKAAIEDDGGITAQELADKLLANEVIPFDGGTAVVEPGLLTGFDNTEINGFKEGVMFSPYIGTIPFVGYIFVLEDGQDTESFIKTLQDNADPRWNICTEAEETVVDSKGDKVFFVMCPAQFEGEQETTNTGAEAEDTEAVVEAGSDTVVEADDPVQQEENTEAEGTGAETKEQEEGDNDSAGKEQKPSQKEETKDNNKNNNNNNNKGSNKDSNKDKDSSKDKNSNNDKKENETSKEDTKEDTKEETLGQTLLADFKNRAAGDSLTVQQIADALIANEAILFSGVTAVVEPGWLTGFSAEITGFKEGVSFGPMIGTIPFIGYVFELEDEGDVKDFKKTLKSNADPRWNICTEAEETVVASVGSKVFFLMCPSSMDQ